MKNKNFGFTLIELLVVIVIIGILATISTATFSGYFKKSRDTERQSFVRNAQQIIVAAQVAADSPDYNFGGVDVAAIKTAVVAELTAQGYSVPADKNGIDYFYFTNLAPIATPVAVASNFQVFACKEDALGTAAGSSIDVHAFVAGTTTASFVTPAQAAVLCATTPVAATTGNTSALAVVNLSS